MIKDLGRAMGVQLPASLKMAYLTLVFAMDENHDCDLSIHELALIAGLSDTRFSTLVQQLAKLDLVEVFKGTGSRDRYNVYLVKFYRVGRIYDRKFGGINVVTD